MDRYYYIATQLPLLKFDSDIDFTQKKLYYEAEKWLGSKDIRILEETNINNTDISSSDPGITAQYKKFETKLRTDLVDWRKAKKENYEHKTTLVPLTLLKENNPLEIEIELLRLRWNYLEELGLEHYFDLEFLIVFNYKLQILERLKSFDKEKGVENFKQYTEVGI